MNVFLANESSTYNQASQDKHWVEAMHKELEALEHNGTWELRRGYAYRLERYIHSFTPNAYAHFQVLVRY